MKRPIEGVTVEKADEKCVYVLKLRHVEKKKKHLN